jgi:cytochrome c biogenesis protein CcmG, thiol:disulfide interchange protein DsbE
VTERGQWLLGIGLLGLIGIALFAGTHLFKRDLFPADIGVEAPDFRAYTLDSVAKEKRFSEYRGQVILLNVWATWCGPCIKEMPSIEALHQSMGPDGLRIVAISIDDPSAAEQVRQFVAAHKLTFDILHDRDGQVQSLYQTKGVPETFIIGRDGVIRKKVSGASDWNSPPNRALITQLLATAAK